jgi:hypothetical protein
MNKELSKNIEFLIEEGEKIKKINIKILFSYNRNQFFAYLQKYITLYNSIRTKVIKNDKKNIHSSIPELHYEDYSLWSVTHLLLMLFLPVTFIIFILQWKYIKEIKTKLNQGLIVFEEYCLNQDLSKIKR